MAKEGTLPLSETQASRFFYGYIIVISAFLNLMIFGGTTFSFGVFLKPLTGEFGWSRAATSGAFSLFMILQGLLFIVTGRLNDRYGPRILLTVAGFFLGVGYSLMAWTSSLWHLYLFYGVMMAVGMSGMIPVTSTVARWFIEKRGLMTGIAISGIGVGTMIMPPLATWLTVSYSWRTSYLVVGIMAGVIIIAATQFMRRAPVQVRKLPYEHDEVKTENPGLAMAGFSTKEALRTRQFWLFCVAFGGFGAFMQAVMVHIVPHAIDLGIPATTAATILMIVGGLSIPSRIILGGASDRIGNRAVLVTCFMMATAALAWLQVAKEMWMFYLFAIVFGFFHGGIASVQSPLIAELFGLRSHGVILGITGLVYTIGAALGTVLTGAVFDITGNYGPAFMGLTLLSLVSMVLSLFLTPGRGGRQK